MSSHAVFLDRDGTINFDTGYISNPRQVVLMPYVGECLFKLREIYKFKLIVISNQSGIARGLLTHKDVKRVNNKINQLLKKFNTSIDAFYYCPFHPDYSSQSESLCRKPSPKMIFDASAEHNIDLSKSYLVGDKATDIEAGLNAKLKTILIKTDFYEEEISILLNQGKTPNFVADNFYNATDYIISDFSGGN
ncbi:D-glycero-alpha-D-manno-heptose-1,7-bisphosphate 7-phosphatase [Melioribacteraceae bacterium 4301-Me]|uniref:D-glycero-alpha-D-manno-heptose-1,7-bisphosphate 7-phosphatase n=1 Tax=Pyranulibacter aquaticus TaxID=3163344 RepID=UPI003598CACD